MYSIVLMVQVGVGLLRVQESFNYQFDLWPDSAKLLLLVILNGNQHECGWFTVTEHSQTNFAKIGPNAVPSIGISSL